MAKKDQVNAGILRYTGADQKKQKAENPPWGVVLTPEQKARVDEIAAELGTNRHKVMQYAMAEFIRRYDAGEKPRKRTITHEELDTKGE